MRRRILIGVVILVVVGAAGAYGYYQAMMKGWVRYNEYDIRTEGQLSVGDYAPDLELSQVDGEGSRMLSDLYREKPVVLAFGSYT